MMVENEENTKAWTLQGRGNAYEALAPISFPVPKLESGCLRIKTEAFGLNYADVLARQGLYNDAPPFPFVPGYEAAGTVVEVGNGVSEVWLGKRVAVFSKFGSYQSHVDALPMLAGEIPNHYSFSEATALVTQYVTAWCACREWTRVQPGEKVLILSAAGGVGQALIALLKPLEVKFFFGSRSEDKATELVQKHGGNALTYANNRPWYKAWKEDHGPDVVFNPIGGLSVGRGMKYLAPGGRMVSYGVAIRSGKKSPIKDLSMLLGFGLHHPVQWLLSSKSLITLNLLRIAEHRPDLIGLWLQEIMSLARENAFPKPKVHTFAWQDLPKAHALLESGKSTGKLAVTCNL